MLAGPTAAPSPLIAALVRLATRDAAVLHDHTTGPGLAVAGAALDRHARGYAAWLLARGVRGGDRVVVQASASTHHVAALIAHLRLGVVHVPLSPHASPTEARHVIDDSGAVQVITAWPTLPLDHDLEPWPTAPTADALAMLIYTSGTTGRPKGVMQTHRALAANLGAVMQHWHIDRADVVVAMLPLFHVHGLGLTVLGPLLAGATVALHARFEVAAVLAAIDAGATVFMGVPTMYHLLLAHLDAVPSAATTLARARLFTAGSAALPATAFARFEAATGHRILERYGMTETLFTLSNPYQGERRAGTVGQPLPGVQVRLVDDRGADVGDGPGEIDVRGDGVMAGYWNNPAATAASHRDGWFCTGDTAVRERGYLRIVGRTSTDIIKSGGYKIGASEIEDVLMASGWLVECAVLGAPDDKWGEVVAAMIVPHAAQPMRDQAAWLAALRPHVEQHLADYKRPRLVRVIDALPRNAMGKVQKAALRDLLPRRNA